MTDIFVKALTLLVQAVGAARNKDVSSDAEAKRWAKEFLVGYALLAIGKAGSMLLLFSDRRIENAFLIVGTKEKTALGGNVEEQMRDELQPEMRYLGTFSWTSLTSHGSVLALHELAQATDGKAEDYLFRAFDDKKADALFYYAFWVLREFLVLIKREFRISVPGRDALIDRAITANLRLKIVTPEEEAKILELRAKKAAT